MEFMINRMELEKLAAETANVKVVTNVNSEVRGNCNNCRSSCSTWCTALCVSGESR